MFKIFNLRLLALVGILFLAACSGDKKHEVIKVEQSGLDIGKVALIVDNQEIKNDSVRFGSVAFMFFDEIKGYELKNGRAYVGCSMSVFDESGKELIKADDIFAQYDATGATPDQVKSFSIHVETGRPMEPNKTYKWKARFWDKVGGGEVVSELDMKITGGQKITTNVEVKGLTAQNAYVYSFKKLLEYEEVGFGSDFVVHLEGLSGYTNNNGLAPLDAQLIVTDMKGNVVLDFKDLTAQYGAGGVPLDALQNFTFTLMLGEPLKRKESYIVYTKLWDKENGNSISTGTKVTLK